MRAPISGRISDKKIDVGNLVVGGQVNATLLATIVSINPIHFIFRRFRSRTTCGMRDLNHIGTARLIAPRGESRARQARGRRRVRPCRNRWTSSTMPSTNVPERCADAPSSTNKDGLLTPGIFARLALYGGDVDAFLIPDTAIVSDQARKIVYTVDADHVIAATSVTLGPMYEGLRVIKTGLKRTFSSSSRAWPTPPSDRARRWRRPSAPSS